MEHLDRLQAGRAGNVRADVPTEVLAEIIRLVAWEELGNQAIAAVLGITPNAVAIRLHRARARFADALARESTSATGLPGGFMPQSWKAGCP